MNDEALDRAFQSVGKACFIRHISLFTDILINDVEAVDMLMKSSDWAEAGCKIRVSNARRIVRSGRTRSAIEMIANSRIASVDIASARKWLSVSDVGRIL